MGVVERCFTHEPRRLFLSVLFRHKAAAAAVGNGDEMRSCACGITSLSATAAAVCWRERQPTAYTVAR